MIVSANNDNNLGRLIKKNEAVFIRAAIVQNGRAVLGFKGYSMQPLLKTGDRVIISPYCFNDLKPGDLICCLAGGQLLIHRIYRKDKNFLATKGDNLKNPDAQNISQEDILGLVLAIETDRGSFLIEQGIFQRMYWKWFSFLRPIAFFFRRWLPRSLNNRLKQFRHHLIFDRSLNKLK